MKLFTFLFLFALSVSSYGQIGLGFYDLPYWGETYYRNVAPFVSENQIPASVYDSTEAEKYWDFTSFGTESIPDTAYYYWPEGTPATFSFPDANMVDYNPENDNGQYQYFIKNETGFYFSGQSGGLATDMGNFDIKAEFRPAVPVLKVPARLGDEVSETSRASVDLLTIGKVLLTTNTNYKINGYGKVKIPTGEEFDVLRIKRETVSEVIFSIKFGENEITDTTTTTETAWEFYTNGYGDAIAKVTKTFDENLGLDQFGFTYKDQRIKSSLDKSATVNEMSLLYFGEYKQIVVKDEALINGGTVQVFNSNGQLVYTSTPSSSVATIAASGWNTGVYIIKTSNSNGYQASKAFIIH